MTTRFDTDAPLIVVRATVTGPARTVFSQLAVDTGATDTIISSDTMIEAGYDPSAARRSVVLSTGSGVASAPIVRITRLTAMGRWRGDFEVVAHNLPPGAGIDGLLGLSFFRGRVLTVDFKRSHVSLR